MQILGELLGRADLEGEDAQQLASAARKRSVVSDDVARQALRSMTPLPRVIELPVAAVASAPATIELLLGDVRVDDPKVHRRPAKPTGKRTARKEVIHRVTIERLPEEVERLGLDAFERIGEDRMKTRGRKAKLRVVR